MPYAAQSSDFGDRVTEGDCPTACANNHHYSGSELFSPASACVPCSDIPAYRTAGFIYAYWGAPNAAPWWPRANTPSGLVQSGTVWRQAGVCSPCPYGMDVEPGDTVLCTLMGGYARLHTLPIATVAIPVTPHDVASHMRSPRIPTANWYIYSVIYSSL